MKGLSDLSTIGGRIKYYRLSAGLSQKNIASIICVDVCTIKRYENNKVLHTLEICNKIASAIGIDPSLIYDEYFNFIASNYGFKIKEIRKKLNLTQIEFGKLLGIHKKTVSRWENEISYPLRRHYVILRKYILELINGEP